MVSATRVTVAGKNYLKPLHPQLRCVSSESQSSRQSIRVERRRTAVDVAVPLSGGRDSRHILLELAREGCRPSFAITVPRLPPTAAEDECVAGLVADHLQLRHIVVRQPRHPAIAEARKNIATHYCADEHAWFFPMVDYVHEHAQ